MKSPWDAVETLAGLALITVGVAWWSLPAACVVDGIVLFAFGVWGRRLR